MHSARQTSGRRQYSQGRVIGGAAAASTPALDSDSLDSFLNGTGRQQRTESKIAGGSARTHMPTRVKQPLSSRSTQSLRPSSLSGAGARIMHGSSSSSGLAAAYGSATSTRRRRSPRRQRTNGRPKQLGEVQSSASLLSRALQTKELPNLTPSTLRQLGYGHKKGYKGAQELITARLQVAKHIYGGSKPKMARPRHRRRMRQVRMKHKQYRFARNAGVDYRGNGRYDTFRVARAARKRLQQREVQPVMAGDIMLHLNGIKGLKQLVGSSTAHVSVRLGAREVQSMDIDARAVPLVAAPIRVPLEGLALSKETYIDLHVFTRVGGERMGLIRIPLYKLLQTGFEHILDYNRDPRTGRSAFRPDAKRKNDPPPKQVGPFPGGRFMPPNASAGMASGIKVSGKAGKLKHIILHRRYSRSQRVGQLRLSMEYAPEPGHVVKHDGQPHEHEGLLHVTIKDLVAAMGGGIPKKAAPGSYLAFRIGEHTVQAKARNGAWPYAVAVPVKGVAAFQEQYLELQFHAPSGRFAQTPQEIGIAKVPISVLLHSGSAAVTSAVGGVVPKPVQAAARYDAQDDEADFELDATSPPTGGIQVAASAHPDWYTVTKRGRKTGMLKAHLMYTPDERHVLSSGGAPSEHKGVVSVDPLCAADLVRAAGGDAGARGTSVRVRVGGAEVQSSVVGGDAAAPEWDERLELPVSGLRDADAMAEVCVLDGSGAEVGTVLMPLTSLLARGTAAVVAASGGDVPASVRSAAGAASGGGGGRGSGPAPSVSVSDSGDAGEWHDLRDGSGRVSGRVRARVGYVPDGDHVLSSGGAPSEHKGVVSVDPLCAADLVRAAGGDAGARGTSVRVRVGGAEVQSSVVGGDAAAPEWDERLELPVSGLRDADAMAEVCVLDGSGAEVGTVLMPLTSLLARGTAAVVAASGGDVAPSVMQAATGLSEDQLSQPDVVASAAHDHSAPGVPDTIDVADNPQWLAVQDVFGRSAAGEKGTQAHVDVTWLPPKEHPLLQEALKNQLASDDAAGGLQPVFVDESGHALQHRREGDGPTTIAKATGQTPFMHEANAELDALDFAGGKEAGDDDSDGEDDAVANIVSPYGRMALKEQQARAKGVVDPRRNFGYQGPQNARRRAEARARKAEIQAQREHDAAVRIQATWRGYRDRKVAHRLARVRRLARMEAEDAAIIIQSAVRGMLGRNHGARQARAKQRAEQEAAANIAKQSAEARYEAAGLSSPREELPEEAGDFPENNKVWATPEHLSLLKRLMLELKPGALKIAFDTESPSEAMVIVACALATLQGESKPSWESGKRVATTKGFRSVMARQQPEDIAAALRCASRAILRRHPRHTAALARIGNLDNEDLAARFGNILCHVPKNAASASEEDGAGISDDAGPAHADGKSAEAADSRLPLAGEEAERAASAGRELSPEVDATQDMDAPAPVAPLRARGGDEDQLVLSPEVVYPVFDLLHHFCIYNAFWRPVHDRRSTDEHRKVLQASDMVQDDIIGEYAGLEDDELAEASDSDEEELAEPSDSGSEDDELAAQKQMTEDEMDEEELQEVEITESMMHGLKSVLGNVAAGLLEELSRVKNPTEDMVIVAGALCTLLNVPQPSWSTARKVIRKKGFIMKLSMVHPSMLAPRSRRVAREILRRHPKHSLDISSSMELVRKHVGMVDYRDGEGEATAADADWTHEAKEGDGPTVVVGDEGGGPAKITKMSFIALTVLHNWCLIQAYWTPSEDSNLQGMAGAAIDKEIIEIFRDMGYANPAEAAAAAAAAAAAEAADGRDIGKVLAAKGFSLAPEHLEHFRRLFANQQADNKERRKLRSTSPRGGSASLNNDMSLSSVASDASSIDSEDDDEDVALSILRTKTPDEPPVKLAEARAQLELISGTDVSILGTLNSGIQPLAAFGACVCVLFGMTPEWGSAKELLAQGDDLVKKLVAYRRVDLSDRVRHYVATILGSRRLLSMHYEKEYQTGRVLATLLRWLVSLISDSRMRAQDIPLPRSARLSSVRYIDRVIKERKLERRKERNEMHRQRRSNSRSGSQRSASPRSASAQSGAEGGLDRHPSSSSLRSGAGGVTTSLGSKKGSFLHLSGKSSQVLDPSGPPPKFPHRVAGASVISWGRNETSVDRTSTIASRAALRSAAWRARARLQTWKKAGMLKTLLSRRTPLGWMRRGLLDVDQADLNAFRRQSPVSRASHIVGCAMCLLLGQKPSWRYTCDMLQEPEIVDFFVRMEVSDVNVRDLALARALLVHQSQTSDDFQLEAAAMKSKLRFTLRFYNWLLVLSDPNPNMPAHGLGLEEAVSDAEVREVLQAAADTSTAAQKDAKRLRTMTRRTLADEAELDQEHSRLSPVKQPRRASLLDTVAVKNRARNKRGSLVVQVMTMDDQAALLQEQERSSSGASQHEEGDSKAAGEGPPLKPTPPPRRMGPAPPRRSFRKGAAPPMMLEIAEEEKED